jgi:YidC/Oxa1 family membrane protein insertase
MGNQRILLYFTLFFVIYMIWAQWQVTYGPQPVPPTDSSISGQQTLDGGQIPQADISEVTSEVQAATSDFDTKDTSAGKRIKVITDVLNVEIDTKGGSITSVLLRQYSEHAETPDENFVLVTDTKRNYMVAQSGLVSANKDSAPSHNALFQSEKSEYRLAEGLETLEVPLYWESENGVKVKKILRFKRDNYVVDVDYFITAGNETWKGSDYLQIVRTTPQKDSENMFIHTYTGGVVYNDEIKYEKIGLDDIADENFDQQLKDGWLAMIEHHFLVAWIPQAGKDNLYFTRYNRNKDLYTIGTRTASTTIQAGQTAEIKSRLVVGPKLQNRLEEIEPGLDLTVDYGVLTIIAKPLFWLLNFYDGIFDNWGWAIIFLTITVKAVFYKLSEMSYRSMARMRKVAPRIKKMKEQYGDDRQAMSKAMMDMYKREKINPMGGCLPILVQMPVFISLYWVLLESPEIRHAPFIFWLTNLTDKDPLFILPVLMGISMFIQQKLNPAPVDPIQQKVFQIMPFAFTIMFAFFPSGLVLYWVVNNILSITQQYIITKRIDKMP